ncbi:MAG TPA: N-acetylglucosamine-6-phosphate deacetylase [Streptosporangiaceae bacterium]|nr:N-acetylglucosamine-6-phosphate deacetylase [Streptosporangiaceae bacterium]
MLIAAARIITASGSASAANAVLSPGFVTCEDGRIVEVSAGVPPSRPDVVLRDGFLLPGFVDLQVNGYFGVELASADADGWSALASRLPATGTTAFMPTFITSPVGEMAAALRRTAGLLPGVTAVPRRARVLGVHLEGPFISAKRHGAHNPDWIISPTEESVETLLSAGAGLTKLVTIAPELDGAMAAIKRLVAAGIVVSVGHSDATAQQVASAAMCGATMVTHLFNAQSPLRHREPGVVGQALADRRLSSSIIVDLHHVAGQVVAIAFAAAPGRLCLISDAAACAGMPPGEYLLGGEPIVLAEGDGTPPVRADGTLAGSALRMDSAVANLVAIGVGLAEAVAAATKLPADLIGRRDLGRIAVGAAADLTWVSDDLRTNATWIGGRQAYGPNLG